MLSLHGVAKRTCFPRNVIIWRIMLHPKYVGVWLSQHKIWLGNEVRVYGTYAVASVALEPHSHSDIMNHCVFVSHINIHMCVDFLSAYIKEMGFIVFVTWFSLLPYGVHTAQYDPWLIRVCICVAICIHSSMIFLFALHFLIVHAVEIGSYAQFNCSNNNLLH